MIFERIYFKVINKMYPIPTIIDLSLIAYSIKINFRVLETVEN